MITPVALTIPNAAVLWTCADCGATNTSTDPIPELPPGYDLLWLCDECYRRWKEGDVNV